MTLAILLIIALVITLYEYNASRAGFTNLAKTSGSGTGVRNNTGVLHEDQSLKAGAKVTRPAYPPPQDSGPEAMGKDRLEA
ncbi:hypothetical protein [Nibribacter koreensis]